MTNQPAGPRFPLPASSRWRARAPILGGIGAVLLWAATISPTFGRNAFGGDYCVTDWGVTGYNSQSSSTSNEPPQTTSKNGTLSQSIQFQLETDQFAEARSFAEKFTKEQKCIVFRWELAQKHRRPKALTAELRVPAASVEALLGPLRAMGTVQTENISLVDASDAAWRVDSEQRYLQDSIRRTLAYANRPVTKTEEALTAEEKILQRQSQIDALEATRRRIARTAGTAEVQLAILEKYQEALHSTDLARGKKLRNAASEGWEGLVDRVAGLAEFLLRNGPVLLFWAAILFWPLRWVYRKIKASPLVRVAKESLRTS